MKSRRSRYLRHRFPPEIISHAVWLYYRFSLSFREVEDLLAERGVNVTYETIRQWAIKNRSTVRPPIETASRASRWHVAPGRSLCHHQWWAQVPLACRGSRRWRDRCSRTIPSGRACGTEILSEAVEESATETVSSRHRQARKLPCCTSRGHALGQPWHEPIRKQSRRGFPPTDATTAATNARLQITQPRSTIPACSRSRSESFPVGKTQT